MSTPKPKDQVADVSEIPPAEPEVQPDAPARLRDRSPAVPVPKKWYALPDGAYDGRMGDSYRTIVVDGGGGVYGTADIDEQGFIEGVAGRTPFETKAQATEQARIDREEGERQAAEAAAEAEARRAEEES